MVPRRREQDSSLGARIEEKLRLAILALSRMASKRYHERALGSCSGGRAAGSFQAN